MDNETLFYLCGAALATSAVVLTFLGLRAESFPGRAAPGIALLFIALVGSTTTFAVLHAKDEEEHEAAALAHASEELEEREQPGVQGGEETAAAGQEGGAETQPQEGAQGAGETLMLAADPTQIAFDTTTLSSSPGEVTIDFTNPAAIEHNVAIEKDGKVLAESETITQGETSVTVELDAGSYAFVCTVPGHTEAGMKGTLTAK